MVALYPPPSSVSIYKIILSISGNPGGFPSCKSPTLFSSEERVPTISMVVVQLPAQVNVVGSKKVSLELMLQLNTSHVLIDRYEGEGILDYMEQRHLTYGFRRSTRWVALSAHLCQLCTTYQSIAHSLTPTLKSPQCCHRKDSKCAPHLPEDAAEELKLRAPTHSSWHPYRQSTRQWLMDKELIDGVCVDMNDVNAPMHWQQARMVGTQLS